MKKNNLNNVELLAPAGSYESFIAAVNAGADAVYMGLDKHNARVMTNNFTLEEYKRAIDYAHKRNVKVYLTLNTLLLDNEIKEAVQNVYELYKVGLDGVILQDLGVARVIHKTMPQLSMHASTQMSVCSLEQVKVLEKLGFKRVVLARELSIEEIEHICKNTSLEIEVFVHGALCVSVSGQCLMSAMIGNRSANRGNCAGTCRKIYSLYNSKDNCISKNKYLLSKKDIFGLDKLEDLKKAGVYSFKIEGRNKTKEYVAGVVRKYKEALTCGYNVEHEKEVLQLFNRSGKSDGYLNGVRYRKDISENSPKNTGLLLGKVLDTKKGYVKVKLLETIDLHDGIEILGEKTVSNIVTCIRDEKFNLLNSRQEKDTIVWIGDIDKAEKESIIYKTSESKLNKSLETYSKENIKRLEYDVSVSIKENDNISATCGDVEVVIDYVPEQSINSSVNEEKVKEAFAKTEDTSVRFNVETNIDDELFVPVSKLNELRKQLVEKIEETKLIRQEINNFENKLQEALKLSNCTETKNIKENSLFVYRYDKTKDYIEWYKRKYNEKLDILYVNISDFKKYEDNILEYTKHTKVYLVIPNVTLEHTTKYINENMERIVAKGIKGILVGNLGFIQLCNELKEKYNIELIGDYSLNTLNSYTAETLKGMGIDKITPLFEIDDLDYTSISKVLPIELVCDMATVMTTRYCVISSFVSNASKKGDCKAECTKANYYLLDELNKRYDIVTDTMDCISRFVRNKKKNKDELEEKFSTRHCVL